MIKIIIDDRERACGIIDILKAYLELEVVVARLTIGDYLIVEKVITANASELQKIVGIGEKMAQKIRVAVG